MGAEASMLGRRATPLAILAAACVAVGAEVPHERNLQDDKSKETGALITVKKQDNPLITDLFTAGNDDYPYMCRCEFMKSQIWSETDFGLGRCVGDPQVVCRRFPGPSSPSRRLSSPARPVSELAIRDNALEVVQGPPRK